MYPKIIHWIDCMVGTISMEPRVAGNFCPGLPGATLAEVNLRNAPTLKLGSNESMYPQRGDSFVTPDARISAQSQPPTPLQNDRQSETPSDTGPTFPQEVLVVNYAEGWESVVYTWYQKQPMTLDVNSNFWGEGLGENVFRFTADGKLTPQPSQEIFPIHIYQGKPPELSESPAPTLPEPKAPAPLVSGPPQSLAEPTPKPKTSPVAPPAGCVGTKVEHKPVDSDNMYKDGSYWKRLDLNLYIMCIECVIHLAWIP